MARAQRKWAAAVKLCEDRVGSLRRTEVQLYLNLAEVYVAAGRRDDAVAVLDRGLKFISVLMPEIKPRTRANLGRRCSPVLSFLEREQFLNRAGLGSSRHRLSGSLEKVRKIERHLRGQSGVRGRSPYRNALLPGA